LPLFCLAVWETVYGGVPFSVKDPYYKKYFTIYQDWIFFAVVHPEKPCPVEMRTPR
jgi:hypothetical protein